MNRSTISGIIGTLATILIYALLQGEVPRTLGGAGESGEQARPSDPEGGLVSLFNGKDLTGWKVPQGDNGHWKVVAGVIDYDAESEAAGDKNLWSEKEFGDFILRVDWRI